MGKSCLRVGTPWAGRTAHSGVRGSLGRLRTRRVLLGYAAPRPHLDKPGWGLGLRARPPPGRTPSAASHSVGQRTSARARAGLRPALTNRTARDKTTSDPRRLCGPSEPAGQVSVAPAQVLPTGPRPKYLRPK